MKDSSDEISVIDKNKLSVELYLDDFKHKGDNNFLILKKKGTVTVIDVTREDLLRMVWENEFFFHEDTLKECEEMFGGCD